ncbi:MAG: BON domain-containing protein [bacterium]
MKRGYPLVLLAVSVVYVAFLPVCEMTGRTITERTELAQKHMAVESIDMAIRTTVLASLASDPYLALQLKSIQVTVHNRVVYLDGEVEKDEQKKKAEEIARGVDKVRDVVNRLKVTGKEEVSGLFD